MQEYLDKRKIIAKSGEKEWQRVLKDRKRRAQSIDLFDKKGKALWFVLEPALLMLISEIEKNRGFLNSLKLPQSFLNRLTRETIKKEAYYSSHIEGAHTSLEEALLHLSKPSQKKYQDESVQMIVNNRDALEYMFACAEDEFSHEMIYALHTILVKNTHRVKPITVGSYRKGAIYVVDGEGKAVYEGPPASEVKHMMNQFVQWLNTSPEQHPLIHAALAHFYFVHVHPFDDGNGRSARALSNVYLFKQDYQFINFLAPSDYFDHHRALYYKAIQNTEAHDSDATYFIVYYLKALVDQLKNVQAEIEKETQADDIKNLLSQEIQVRLDRKQVKALQYMLGTGEKITTKKYCKLCRCSDETARKDFNTLLNLGVIEKIGAGRATGYILKAAGNSLEETRLGLRSPYR
jgi:Fic family protein